jgi:hypothetical protein
VQIPYLSQGSPGRQSGAIGKGEGKGLQGRGKEMKGVEENGREGRPSIPWSSPFCQLQKCPHPIKDDP